MSSADPHPPDMAGESGQATIELVAFLPLLLVVALTAAALLAGYAAAEQAGQAAQAGAMALLQDRDPREAARRALPDGARATVDVEGRRVTVTVRPRLPVGPVAAAMTARVTADAGPEPP